MIASNIRVPGSYNEVDASGANNRLPAYRVPMLVVAPKIKTPSQWAGTTVTALGAKIRPTTANSDGRYYICIVAGSTGASEPTWPGAGGSVVDGTVTWRELCDASKMIAVHTPTVIYSADGAADAAGRGSIAHRMCRAAFRQYQYIEMTLIMVDDDDTGVIATATLTFAGTADGSGSAEIRVGNDKVTIAWEDGNTASQIAALLDAAIAEKHDLPITSSVAAAVVTQRSKNAGIPGNEIGRYNGSAYISECTISGTGVTCTITAFASGANNPDVTDAFTAATLGYYKVIAMPYKDTDNIVALQAYLDSVSNEVNCKGARAFLGTTATIAIATTLATVNDPRVHVEFVRKCRFTSFEIAAAAAAEHAATGHPSLPLNNLKMGDCDAPAISDRLEFNETNALLWVGVTPWNADGMGAVRCVRSVTSYTVSEAGSPDDTYLDTTVIAQLDYNREATRAHDLLLYQGKVLRDNHVDGEPEFVLTPGDINSDHIALFKKLERYGTCQNVDLHKARFIAVKDPNVAGRVNQDIPVQVVEGAHIFANTLRMVTSV